MRKTLSTIIIALSLTGMLAVVGCVQTYGNIKRNPDVLKLYKDRSDLPDYNYYYSGLDIPSAVIGIDKKSQFSDRLWIKIENNQEVYDKINRLRYAARPSTLLGGDIVDSDNKKIGIWFSYYHRTVVLKKPDGTIEVHTPPREISWDEDRVGKQNKPPAP